MNPKPQSVEEYLSWYQGPIREKLDQIRTLLKEVLPEAKEVISYHMPAYRTSEVLVYFAGAKNHLGFYPTNTPIVEFKKELEGYVTSKGAIQFPYNQPLPVDLIKEIAIFRLEEAKFRAERKKPKK
ncbi:iron chaperone [Algoriphagus sp. oki45]|uniref:iron chaperone n=1 Tax=Algoriphagus sp. oki45 TaxID=3067294 RepID=UPI0030C71FD7